MNELKKERQEILKEKIAKIKRGELVCLVLIGGECLTGLFDFVGGNIIALSDPHTKYTTGRLISDIIDIAVSPFGAIEENYNPKINLHINGLIGQVHVKVAHVREENHLAELLEIEKQLSDCLLRVLNSVAKQSDNNIKRAK